MFRCFNTLKHLRVNRRRTSLSKFILRINCDWSLGIHTIRNQQLIQVEYPGKMSQTEPGVDGTERGLAQSFGKLRLKCTANDRYNDARVAGHSFTP